jgi:hypothetical protein
MRCGSRGLSLAVFARTRAGHTAAFWRKGLRVNSTAWDVSRLIESANAWNPSRATVLRLASGFNGGPHPQRGCVGAFPIAPS